MKNWHQSQRGYFAGQLYKEMRKNPDIYLLLGDLGYGMADKLIKDFPDRALSVGASEQAMMGIAVGLAQEGKIPFVYTITSFFLRCAETIHLYVSEESAPVILVGGGRNDDYGDDGISHYGTAAQKFIGDMKIDSYYPNEKERVPEIVKAVIKRKQPAFISLRR